METALERSWGAINVSAKFASIVFASISIYIVIEHIRFNVELRAWLNSEPFIAMAVGTI